MCADRFYDEMAEVDDDAEEDYDDKDRANAIELNASERCAPAPPPPCVQGMIVMREIV